MGKFTLESHLLKKGNCFYKAYTKDITRLRSRKDIENIELLKHTRTELYFAALMRAALLEHNIEVPPEKLLKDFGLKAKDLEKLNSLQERLGLPRQPELAENYINFAQKYSAKNRMKVPREYFDRARGIYREQCEDNSDKPLTTAANCLLKAGVEEEKVRKIFIFKSYRPRRR